MHLVIYRRATLTTEFKTLLGGVLELHAPKYRQLNLSLLNKVQNYLLPVTEVGHEDLVHRIIQEQDLITLEKLSA